MWKRKSKKLAILFMCTVMLLSSASTALAFGKGTKGPDVYVVQGMLKSLGYFGGTISGTYDSQTESAVKNFQRKYGLPITGAVDDQTLQSILWAYGNLKIPKKPEPTPAPPPSTPAPTPSPSPAPQPSPSPTVTELTYEERNMVDLVNKERTSAGLAPLEVDAQLTATARLKSKDMVDNNYFSHDSPTYGSPFDMMKKFGISYRSSGENIACNQNVQAAHQALMNSPGHRANILSKDFTHIGVGIVDGGPCGKMFTQQFVGR
jgi:uncharacterized YkwD family protein